MASNSSRRLLARAATSLALAATATMLTAGCAHAHTTIAGHTDSTLGQREPGSAPKSPGDVAGQPTTCDRCDTAPPPTARTSTISVLIAGDQVVFRSGVRAVVGTQTDLHCVAEVGAATAPADLRRLRPDVAVLDLDTPGLDDALAADPTLTDGTRLLTFTEHATDENLYRAVRLGASGFLTKDLPAERLVTAIRRAAHQDDLIDPRLTRRLVTRLAHGDDPFPPAPEAEALTTREHEILLLIARAHTNPEIAELLGIGEQTVKTHVSHVLSKLGVRDRVHAAVYAHTRHLVPAPSGATNLAR
ncbi:response regulator transcription factor [Nocardia wallacei]|uniref:response regulator transcription factor n=1 Tax=Nocardia wallacei TaxID=480035 RepID=UPI002453E66C|nr:response regulator transcription factor [Nocardia wallacei]